MNPFMLIFLGLAAAMGCVLIPQLNGHATHKHIAPRAPVAFTQQADPGNSTATR